jgi:integrase family protein with SAM-like domain
MAIVEQAERRGGVRRQPSERAGSGGQPASIREDSLTHQLDPLLRQLRQSSDLSPQSRARLHDLLDRFGSFLSAGQGVESLTEVTQAHVVLFLLAAPAAAKTGPAAATMHLRRSSIRLLFRLARDAGLDVGDPTIDVKLPTRSARPLRPLTDTEIDVCRRASLNTLVETRLPAAWALAEATARTSELPSSWCPTLIFARGKSESLAHREPARGAASFRTGESST